MKIMSGDLIEIDGDGYALYLFSEKAPSYRTHDTRYDHWILADGELDVIRSDSPNLFSVGERFTEHRLGQVRLLSSFKEAIS